ncbi:hypothetical protein ACQP2U_10385 [Nocardia sp. CA-084685]|uniref:hypothetical protein n=1 Tax=Nocardia sp. CA-084685 TaxID=3239970 RepID=UPI003D99F7EE
MSAPAIEATMPASAAQIWAIPALPAPMRDSAPTSFPVPVPQVQASSVAEPVAGLSAEELAQRLIAAHQRTAELEEQLAAAVAARDAAEHEAAQLEDRNREMASDLDNALDQLAGHALHEEQERLVRPPAWSPWAASTDREGYDR